MQREFDGQRYTLKESELFWRRCGHFFGRVQSDTQCPIIQLGNALEAMDPKGKIKWPKLPKPAEKKETDGNNNDFEQEAECAD